MAGREPKMKIGIGADTSDFDKGAKIVKKGLTDLSKTGTQALGDLGNAFGVNTGKVEQMISSVRGLGAKMAEASSTGVSAFGKLLGSITPLGGAIAGLGLATAIAGFKQLKAEADNFKSTIDGMNMSMATSAYISTYKQVLHDVNSDTGRAVAEAMDKWERGFGRFKAQLGATFTTFMTSSTLGDFGESFKELRQSFKEADEAATRNADRASQIADIKKEELQVRKNIADIDVEIAEQRRIIRDRSKSAAERSEAEAKVREMIADKTAQQESITKRLYNLQAEITSEAGSGYEEMKEVTDLYVQWKSLSVSEIDSLATIDRYSRSIASSSSKNTQSWAQTNAEILTMLQYLDKRLMNNELNAGFSAPSISTPGITAPSLSIVPRREDAELFKETFQAYVGDMEIAVGIKADTQKIQDISNEVNSLISQSVTTTAQLIGNLVGTLAGGGDAWGDFKNAALSAFGDMAIAVGKIAVSAGLASSGIQAALELGNPYIAIAAGAALIALGSAVKASLSSVANGDYSAGAGSYSGGYSYGSGGNGYETREVDVKVTGTLVANGDQLQAVLNSSNQKSYYTG